MSIYIPVSTLYSADSIIQDDDLYKPYLVEQSSLYDSSFRFDWNGAFDSPSVQKLREIVPLSQLIQNISSPLQKAIAITNYVHHLWEHDGWNNPNTRDPVAIVDRVLKEKDFVVWNIQLSWLPA